jgi:hypothetical protein
LALNFCHHISYVAPVGLLWAEAGRSLKLLEHKCASTIFLSDKIVCFTKYARKYRLGDICKHAWKQRQSLVEMTEKPIKFKKHGCSFNEQARKWVEAWPKFRRSFKPLG